MAVNKNSFCRRVFLFTILGTLLANAAQGQSGPPEAQSGKSLADAIKSGHAADVGSMRFKTSPFADALKRNRRAFAAATPVNLPAELAAASLPSLGPKSYSFPALSRMNFLAVSTSQTPSFDSFNAAGLNRARLFSSKAPDPGELH